jgi:hypothetical protein
MMIETALRDTATSGGSRFFGSSLAPARPAAQLGGPRGPLTENRDIAVRLDAITLRFLRLRKRGDGSKAEKAARQAAPTDKKVAWV